MCIYVCICVCLGVRPVALDPYDHLGWESGSVEQEFVSAVSVWDPYLLVPWIHMLFLKGRQKEVQKGIVECGQG